MEVILGEIRRGGAQKTYNNFFSVQREAVSRDYKKPQVYVREHNPPMKPREQFLRLNSVREIQARKHLSLSFLLSLSLSIYLSRRCCRLQPSC